jgi:hypothetical protein
MLRNAYAPFLGWLIQFGLILFGGFLLWQYELLSMVFTSDQTYLSSIILALFIGISLYIGVAAWRLSRETDKCLGLSKVDNKHTDSLAGWATEHLTFLTDTNASNTDLLQARLVERVHSGHSSGWFLSDFLLRLGLIGTVIGFVIMLGSVYELKQDDVHALQQLLTRMGGGMQVALYTTLTGLGSAMLIGLQCHWLDRYADRLISRIIELGSNATGEIADG